jgi:hypothetical protein
LYKNLRENVKRNIKKSEHAGFVCKKNISVDEIIEMATEQSKSYSLVSAEDYENFRNLYNYLFRLSKAVSYGIFTPQKQLIGSCVFFFSHNRAYYILACNHPDGKTLGASHALINAFIHDYADSPLILDFEGSDLPGLGFFYSSFGAKIEKYAAIKLNKLPFWSRWLKK